MIDVTIEGLDMSNTNNFTIDQVALVVRLWSQNLKLDKLIVIAVVREGLIPYFPGGITEVSYSHVVWIYNNNEVELLNASDTINYYSGLRHREDFPEITSVWKKGEQLTSAFQNVTILDDISITQLPSPFIGLVSENFALVLAPQNFKTAM